MANKAKIWRPVEYMKGIYNVRTGTDERLEIRFTSDVSEREHRIVAAPNRPHIRQSRRLLGADEFLPLGPIDEFLFADDLRGVRDEPRIIPTHSLLIEQNSDVLGTNMVAVRTDEGTFAAVQCSSGVRIFEYTNENE